MIIENVPYYPFVVRYTLANGRRRRRHNRIARKRRLRFLGIDRGAAPGSLGWVTWRSDGYEFVFFDELAPFDWSKYP